MDTPHAQASTPIQVLRLPEVCKVTGLCRSLIYQMQAEHRFPKGIKLGVRSVGWLQSEVQSWLEQRVSTRADATRQDP